MSVAESGHEDEPASTVEEFVKTQVINGKEANVSGMPDNQVRSTFLEALLFNTVLPWNLEKTGIHILGAKLIGALNLANLEVTHELSLVGCEFIDGVVFSNTSFTKSLDLSKSTFDRRADFNMMRAEGRADFNDTTFKGPVSFQHSAFANDLSVDRATFANDTETVWFNNIRVAYNLLNNNGSFSAGANFSGADISRGLLMSATQFRNVSSVADFHNLKVGADIRLDNAVFAGVASFSSVDIVGSLVMSGARFNNKGGKALFDHAKIGSDIQAHGTQFEGQVSFKHAQISGRLDISGAKFNGLNPADFGNVTVGDDIAANNATFAAEARFDYAKVTGGLDMRNAEFHDTILGVNFTGVDASGITTLTGSKLPAGISFENASFDRLEIQQLLAWNWKNNSIHLIGLTFREISADEDPLVSSDKLIEFANFAKYDPRTYEKLEAYFTEQGQPEKADKIFIEGKRREREEVLRKKQNLTAWSGSLLLDWLVGYGRIPALALGWSASFVLIGCFVFRKDEMEPQQSEAGLHRYSAFLYSLDVFAPIIDLKAKSRWA